MLETADKTWGWTLGTWLNISGLILFVVGNPVLTPLKSTKPPVIAIRLRHWTPPPSPFALQTFFQRAV